MIPTFLSLVQKCLKKLDQFKDEKSELDQKFMILIIQESDSAFKYEGINIILKPLNHLRKLNRFINYFLIKLGYSLILIKYLIRKRI